MVLASTRFVASDWDCDNPVSQDTWPCRELSYLFLKKRKRSSDRKALQWDAVCVDAVESDFLMKTGVLCLYVQIVTTQLFSLRSFSQTRMKKHFQRVQSPESILRPQAFSFYWANLLESSWCGAACLNCPITCLWAQLRSLLFQSSLESGIWASLVFPAEWTFNVAARTTHCAYDKAEKPSREISTGHLTMNHDWELSKWNKGQWLRGPQE